MLQICEDDLTGGEVQALLAFHVADMRGNSPPEHAFALDLSGLRTPAITVWSAWHDGTIAEVGALKRLDGQHAEIKSMRTHPDHVRKGVGAALLDHFIAHARAAGMSRLSLETGSGPAFEPALGLYRTRGFENGPAFGGYSPSAFNQFLHLTL